MVYERGGKVWVNEDGSGRVFLEKDWAGDRIPQDLVEEAGMMGVDFCLSSPWERAELGGYALIDGVWVFYLADKTLKFHGLENKQVYLVCEMNGWRIHPDWLLKPLGDGLGVKFPISSPQLKGCFEFKFISACGSWIEPHAEFPSVVVKGSESRNYFFDSTIRTGRDVVAFRIVQPGRATALHELASFRPQGDFGYSENAGGCSFRIHAPRAISMKLLLYEAGSLSDPSIYEMRQEMDDSWIIELDKKAEGIPYRFAISCEDGVGTLYNMEIVDPYARAMISRTGPGLAIAENKRVQIYNPPPLADCVVVEVHVRDLLANITDVLSSSERMGFKGLSKWLQSEDCYLRELGANVVELQPVQEFDARDKEEYHWGYMPVNFFSPASAYSSDAENGSGIEEFSELVDAFHGAGMAVVIDVVYNHMGIPPHLMHLDRELYFMTEEDGRLTNHSGCGNDLRCDSEPVRKLVLDSLVYWVEKFDVDGFRFDLGELIGEELLSEIERELKKIKPGILLFAEPWSFRGRLPKGMNRTSYALWSDACREGLLQFVKGEQGCSVVEDLFLGNLDANNLHPCQSVNYLESHDDYSLVDRFRDLLHWDDDQPLPQEVAGLATLATAMLLLAPGVPMLSAGQDFLRHKRGVRNTYLRGDLNALDYSLIEKHRTEADFIQAMIRLRLSENGLRMRTSMSDEWEVRFLADSGNRAFGFRWHSSKQKSAHLVLVNSGMKEVEFSHPEVGEFLKNGKSLASYGDGVNKTGKLSPLSFNWLLIP